MSQKTNKENKRLYVHAKDIYKPRSKFCVQEVTNLSTSTLEGKTIKVKVRLDYPHLVHEGKATVSAYPGTGIVSPYTISENIKDLSIVFTDKDTVEVTIEVPASTLNTPSTSDIQLVRKTSISDNFKLSNGFSADNVDKNNMQLLHIAQEIIGDITPFAPYIPSTPEKPINPINPSDPNKPIVPDKVNNKFYIAVSRDLSDTTVYSLNYAFDNNINIKIPKGTYNVKAIDHRVFDNKPVVITNLHPQLNTIVDLYACNIPVENWYKGGTNTLTKIKSNVRVINGELQYTKALPENPVYIITNNNVFAIPLEGTSYEKIPKEGTIYEVEEDSSSLVPIEHPYLNYVWCSNDDIARYKKGIVLSTPVATIAGSNYYMATEDVPYLVCSWEFSDNTIKPKGYWNKFKFLYPVQYGVTYYKDFLDYSYETKSYINLSHNSDKYTYIKHFICKNRVLLLGVDTYFNFNESSFPYYTSLEPIYEAKFPKDTPEQLSRVSGITKGIDCPYDISLKGNYININNLSSTYGYSYTYTVEDETNRILYVDKAGTRSKFLCGLAVIEQKEYTTMDYIPPNINKKAELSGYNVDISPYIDKEPIGDIINNSIIEPNKNNKHSNIFDYYFKDLIIDTCNTLYNAKDSSSVYSKHAKQDYTAYNLLVKGLENPDYIAKTSIKPLTLWEQDIYKYE